MSNFFNACIHPLIRAYQSHFLAGTLIFIWFFFFQEMCLYVCYLSSSVKLIYCTVTQSPKGSCHHIIMTMSQNIQQESLQTTFSHKDNKKQPKIVLLPHIPDLNIMSQHQSRRTTVESSLWCSGSACLPCSLKN